MELGKPDAGKPPVRFDEGREVRRSLAPGPLNPSLPAYSTQRKGGAERGAERSRRLKHGAPAKRASTRVKVPSVQLDGSAPKTVPTASPRGGVGSRHGVEPAGRNEHMKHINEPRKSTTGSRTPQVWVKAAESESRPTVVGSDNGPAGFCSPIRQPPAIPFLLLGG